MRNCPRVDLGHEPYEGNQSFKLVLGTTFTLCQCPVGMITERSRAFIDLFLDCHTEMPGWTGSTFVQICWPTAQTLWEEYQIIVEAFRIIRAEIEAMQAEEQKRGGD